MKQNENSKAEFIRIKILDPKVKGVLQELEYLGLIALDTEEIQSEKQAFLERFAGQNLKDIDLNLLKS